MATTGKIGSLLLPDYDKCIRDMVSINANATGVIFPTNEAIDFGDNSFENKGQNFEYVHEISARNKEDKFYTFPIFVPKTNSDRDRFEQWKKTFIDNCKNTFKKIVNIVNQYK